MKRCLLQGLCLALTATTAWGLDVPEGTVSGRGTVVIERLPDVLRVEVPLLAKGRDYRDALMQLTARRARAENWLVGLGASPGTITVADPAIIPAQFIVRTAPETSTDGLAPIDPPATGTAPRPAGRARHAAPAVSARLRAEIPLKTSSTDDLLIVAEDLQQRIKEADLAGMKELGDDASMLNIPACGSCGSEAGAPSFIFVGRIGAEERAKARAVAFAKARAEAGQLAQAAGCELGALRSVSGTSSGGLDSFGLVTSGLARGGTLQGLAAAAVGGSSGSHPEDQQEESTSAQPGKVPFRIVMTASFGLKSPAEVRASGDHPR
jgi:hypothetical protein